MKRIPHLTLLMAAGFLGLSACEKSSTTSPSLINEATVTSDVAAAAGDAIASNVSTMIGNEGAAALPASPVGFDVTGSKGESYTYSRTRTCYDATKAVVTNCDPTTTRLIVTQVLVSGSRSFTDPTGTATVTGATHRSMLDSLFRNFTNGTEVSRTHDATGFSHDTTTFTSSTLTRTHDEAAQDSVEGVTWQLPRINNPFPISGKIVRIDTVHVTFQNATTSSEKTEVKRVEVDFPPIDNQGNVVLKIDNKTCNLNLVTHKVTNCQ